ncbi:pimeloyl-ACP methyl ester carboxylesterase [Saccharopolyspora erythraea NRRL 2338]|uniref:Haloalkane dehalogenase n=2 Tax=Saccharopolyspora erythraea TaxID=1836 RepID=A4FLT0_SACEN|nr:alpha/beta hydrolase [Saccharopolyspora erythraea]EQD88164.1 alpha/beta hydrolase [Saccharopolyspora erythraea D]PFG98642.1 pimeloyl-ACP methyl ester carboxylesterase [Saccharopolyspora erythraea NRRL 2338]QRK88671.1 alpha/beta hydrolase [Saccharopolyspora erythraea]CAM05005.1 haloalkane dehalogenase [Saccharopolyspora erythraea NRRL 2338]
MSTCAEATTWRLPQRVRVSGGEVATGVWGEGPPVVLVHGTPAWSFLWRDVVAELAGHHTVHVWDMLGFGESIADPGVTPSIARQARTLAELVEHWGLDEPSLVGHDIGGGVVLRAHLLEAVPVRGLALVDAAVIGPWNTTFTEHMQRHAEVYRTMPEHVFGDIVAARLRTATHRPMSEDVAAGYLAPWAGAAGQGRWIDQVAAVSCEDTREVVARLDRITAPTLVLWGERDEWLAPSAGDRLAAAIPGARRETIEAAGHFLPEDAPRRTARALLRHLGPASAAGR